MWDNFPKQKYSCLFKYQTKPRNNSVMPGREVGLGLQIRPLQREQDQRRYCKYDVDLFTFHFYIFPKIKIDIWNGIDWKRVRKARSTFSLAVEIWEYFCEFHFIIIIIRFDLFYTSKTMKNQSSRCKVTIGGDFIRDCKESCPYCPK